jgi:hypothetical protein
MPDHRIQDAPQFQDTVSDEDRDECVLGLVIDSGWPWTVDEIACELRSPLGAADAVSRLSGAGLVHRIGAFVLPTRAARHFDQIAA